MFSCFLCFPCFFCFTLFYCIFLIVLLFLPWVCFICFPFLLAVVYTCSWIFVFPLFFLHRFLFIFLTLPCCDIIGCCLLLLLLVIVGNCCCCCFGLLCELTATVFVNDVAVLVPLNEPAARGPTIYKNPAMRSMLFIVVCMRLLLLLFIGTMLSLKTVVCSFCCMAILVPFLYGCLRDLPLCWSMILLFYCH